MKFCSLLAIACFAFQSRAAEVCGLLQVEDFRDSIVTSLVDFTTYPGTSKVYTVTNSDTLMVRGMVTGQCYCVIGDASDNPAFSGDTMYQLLNLRLITKGPFGGCAAPLVPKPAKP